MDRNPNGSNPPGSYGLCVVRSMVSGCMGFTMGGVVDLITAAVMSRRASGQQSQSSSSAQRRPSLVPYKLTMRTAKDLAFVCVLFTGLECSFAVYEGKSDLKGVFTAGAITGAIFGSRHGPAGSLVGALAYSIVPTSLHYFLRRPSS